MCRRCGGHSEIVGVDGKRHVSADTYKYRRNPRRMSIRSEKVATHLAVTVVLLHQASANHCRR